MEVDDEGLAWLVIGMLEKAPHGTVVTVRPNGSVETELPGTRTPAYERREPLLATFVASRRLPEHHEVVLRLRQGRRRLAPPSVG